MSQLGFLGAGIMAAAMLSGAPRHQTQSGAKAPREPAVKPKREAVKAARRQSRKTRCKGK